METTCTDKDGVHWYINRKDDQITVSTHDATWKPIEFFKFTEGHKAFEWDDTRLMSYIEEKFFKQSA